MLHALAALRGDVAAIDLLDRGIFQWIAVGALLDLAWRRRLHFGLTVLLVVVLLSLWSLELNSGAIWTGFTCFLGAYNFATRDELPVRARLILTLAALGAACTLRQNYLLPAGLFGLLLVVAHLREAARASSWRAAWAAERRTALFAVGAAAVVVVPYMVAALRSSGTALYPVLLGTGNPAAPLRPTGGTFLDEISFFLMIVFTPEPIHVWWLLLPIMVIAKDPRPLRPWRAYAIGCAVGFVALVHSFMLSDAWNLWRYAFGYITPLAMVFAIEASARLPFLGRGDSEATGPEATERGAGRSAAPGGLVLPVAATFLLWLALVVNLIETRQATARRFVTVLQNIKAGWVFGTAKPEPRLRSYGALQRSIPEDAPLAILLDDPWALDYARNRIVSLDLPGFTAPAPGLPSFTTPEHWRAYFVSRGIRYLAFTDPGESTYLYRRAHWVERMFRDDELYQFMATHMVDTLDALTALAGTSTVLFHGDGLYAIDLGEGAGAEPPRGPPERARQDACMRRISELELGNAWQLANRSTVVFMRDGLGPTPLVLPVMQDHTSRGFLGMIAGLIAPPQRWLMDRTRVRVLGTGRERIHIELLVHLTRAYTKPMVTLSIDGEVLVEARPDADGNVVLDAAAACTGWCELYIVFNSTFDWWQDPETNGVAQLLAFDWAAP
jgi:hypothetical protein